jgi:hypothetical protein
MRKFHLVDLAQIFGIFSLLKLILQTKSNGEVRNIEKTRFNRGTIKELCESIMLKFMLVQAFLVLNHAQRFVMFLFKVKEA